MAGRFLKQQVYKPILRPAYQQAIRPAAAVARRQFNNTARALAMTNPLSAVAVRDYENEIRKQRKRAAEAKEARTDVQMARAGNARTMSSAPVTVGMTIKRPPISSQESGKYDSKIVSATEVIFSSVISTDNSYSGGSQQQEMDLNPIHPSLRILADEAKNFQLFRFKKATVIFESTCNSTITGAVVLGQLADVLDTAPPTYDDAVLLKDSIQANVWQSVALPLDLDSEFRYVTFGASGVTGAEIRQVNQAKIFFGLVNTLVASGALGNIKLDYTVELCKRINGTELTSFDQSGVGLTSASALATLGQMIPTARLSSWFQKDLINQRLIILPRCTCVVNLTIASQIDEDAVGPGSSIVPFLPTNVAITPTLVLAYGAQTSALFANQNLYTAMYSFKASQLSCYLDFSSVVGVMTGPLDINISIDIYT